MRPVYKKIADAIRYTTAILCSTPGMRAVCTSNFGYAYRNNPSAKMIALRFNTCRRRCLRVCPRAVRELNEKTIETPTMNRKKGKMRSVGVQPFHFACSSGQYVCWPSPELLTRIIAAIVIPRNTSSEVSRVLDGAEGTLAIVFLGIVLTVVDDMLTSRLRPRSGSLRSGASARNDGDTLFCSPLQHFRSSGPQHRPSFATRSERCEHSPATLPQCLRR